jgi:zinc/manganese transport system permease protein
VITAFVQPSPTWNVISDARQLFDYPFMVHALVAGTIVAIVAAPVGWVMVLRRETFAGHTLAVVGFPGAAAAALVGISVEYGYFGACLVAALVIALVPTRRPGGSREESAVIGTTQAFALACGLLFVSLYAGNVSGVSSLLFGSDLGITTGQVVALAAFAVVALAVLAGIGRPLLLASIDPELAASRKIPVGAVAVVFLVLLGVAAAETSQITGSLLVFALMVLPPAAAQAMTPRPAASLAVAVGVGVGVTWAGLAAAYFTPYPSGFWVTTFAFAVYVVAQLVRRIGLPVRVRVRTSA